jgi:hypothetical protein
MVGSVKDMPVPFMGPPILVDKKAGFAIAEMPAIVLYLRTAARTATPPGLARICRSR